MRYRLASLFGCSLGELDARLAPEEFAGWIAYWQLEPWGCYPADQRAEVAAQLFFQANSKPGTEVPRFFDRDAAPARRQMPTDEEVDASVLAWMASRGLSFEEVVAEPDPEAAISTEN